MEYLVHNPSQLASAFKSRRNTCALTQAAVASKVGLLPKTVSSLEGHPEFASVESFFKLVAALDLELVLRPKEEPRRVEGGETW
jgi:HTH-type transcriptional regulator/antitoxin HipB